MYDKKIYMSRSFWNLVVKSILFKYQEEYPEYWNFKWNKWYYDKDVKQKENKIKWILFEH